MRAEVIRLACELPADSDVPLARWSSSELAREVVARGIAEHISGVTVWRWLSEDAIKSWQQNHEETFGSELLNMPLDAWPEHYPNVPQAKFLLKEGVRMPLIGGPLPAVPQ